MRAGAVFYIMLMATACEHSEPFALEATARSGPFAAARPLQLTFSPAADRLGSAFGDSLVYTAFLPRQDGCLAILPLAGGVRSLACPDTVAVAAWAWLEPAVSPDGAWIAYVEERRSSPGALVVSERRVVIAPRDRPAEPVRVIESSFQDENGVRVNVFRLLTWVDNDRLRFVGDSQGSGSLATPGPVGLYDLRRSDGSIARRPGAAPLGWTRDAGVDWVIAADEPQALYAVDDDGTRRHVLDVEWAVATLAVTDGWPVVLEIRPPQAPGGLDTPLLQLYDTAAGGAVGMLPTGGVPLAVRAVPGRRAVLIESAGTGQSNLWYVEVR